MILLSIFLAILNKDFAMIQVVPYLKQMVVHTVFPIESKSTREYGNSLTGSETHFTSEPPQFVLAFH